MASYKYMKQNNTILLRCLYRDLGMSYVDKAFDMRKLGELRKRLLELTESGTIADKQQWAITFNSTFGTKYQWDDIERPAVFRDVYQALSFPLKIRSDYTTQQQHEYIQKFRQTEMETGAWQPDRSNPVSRLARFIVRYTCRDLDLGPGAIQELGRHGPGAVAGREKGADKNYFSPPPSHMASYYPYDTLIASVPLMMDVLTESSELVPERFITARLALVPKDFKGPRGVFISPKEAVFCQLGVDGAFRRLADRCWLGAVWAHNDQTPSQECAHIGSYGGTWSTLDLSDASDRIPLRLVSWLFNRLDYLRLCATRPSFVELPDGEIHKLRMFAPMGDGKTFPVLTLIVASICLAAMMVQDGVLAARPVIDWRRWYRKLRVFGDDIAVHAEYYDSVVKALEAHNLKVNTGKSFTKGRFRESCGYDGFAGVDVTPLRQRINLDDPDEPLASLVEFHNMVQYKRPDLVGTIEFLRGLINSRTRGQVAWVRDFRRAPFGLFCWDPIRRNLRDGHQLRVSNLHRLEVRTLIDMDIVRYPEALDPRWDLNYALLPKRGGDTQPSYASRRRTEIVGSPSALRYLNRHLRRLGMPLIPEPRAIRSHAWQPIGSR